MLSILVSLLPFYDAGLGKARCNAIKGSQFFPNLLVDIFLMSSEE